MKMKTVKCNETKIFYFKADIINHLLALSDGERELRFFKSMNEYQIVEWVENLSNKEAEFVLLFNEDNDKLIGFGHVSVCRKNEVTGDIAFSLDSDVRGNGLGFSLFKQLLQVAKTLQLDKLYIMFKASNQPVKAMVAKFGFVLNYEFGDVEGVMI
jgi:RimJ/RimL family protein N-acetyltransferase